MMRQFELVERVKAYDPDADEDLLNRAYVFGIRAHGNQKRDSGDPYFSHPLEVAGILTDLKLDVATIVTALLHDTMVDGVTKLSKIELQSEQTKQAENFRKFMLAMSHDVRVLLVKLADRMHNMRTLVGVKTPERRKRIATETMEIYAPLAGRMGMQNFREEFEDLAFAQTHPDTRAFIVQRLEALSSEKGALTKRIEVALIRKLSEHNIVATVTGREKRPYSIWRKMEEKKVTFDQLSDIFALRVVVGSIDECYKALGVLHQSWRHVPGRFKDYISLPKSNNYRSLHTEIYGPENQRIELQIRSQEMHEIAESGIAAHWSYKDKVNGRQPFANIEAYDSLRSLIQSLKEGNTPEEFLEHTRLELFQDQVFCFTPKGRLITLPRGATPIDFAYAVHTEVGDTCVGAKVNGRHVILSTKLKNGETVEIISSPRQGPSAAWETMVVTGKAQSSIRRYLRNAERSELQRMGRAILEKTFKDAGHELTDKLLAANLKKLKASKLEDIFQALARGETSPVDILKTVMPEYKPGPDMQGWANRLTKSSKSSAIPIQSMVQGLAFHLAKCCQPLSGDRIIGVITAGQGVIVHTADCERLEDVQDQSDRWVDVKWSKDASKDVQVGRLKIAISNVTGTLASVCEVISRQGGNITNLKIINRTPIVFDILVDIEVNDARHLAAIVAALRASPSVNGVDRPHGERELLEHDT
jgi:GTP pyrophosphokinase